jgi:predicted Zn-dependent protease
LLLIALPAMAQPPGEIGKGINLYSKEKEAAIGAQYATEVRRQNKPLDSDAARVFVARITTRIAKQFPESRPSFTVDLIVGSGSGYTEPWSLPAGFLFVPSGVFLNVANEAEFAGVLAHAMVHAGARHWTRMATRGQLANQTVIPLVLMGGWSGSHAQPGSAALPLGFLKFQRGFEREADLIAAQVMAKAAYDPSALVAYIDRVQVDPEKPQLSPLPLKQERIAAITEAIAAIPPREYPVISVDFERVREEVQRIAAAGEPKPIVAPSLRRPGDPPPR